MNIRDDISHTVAAAQIYGAISAVCRECGGELHEIERLFPDYLKTPTLLKVSGKLKKILFVLQSSGIKPHARFLAKLIDRVQIYETSGDTKASDIEMIGSGIRQLRSEIGKISGGNVEPTQLLINAYRNLCKTEPVGAFAVDDAELFMPFIPAVEFDWNWIPSKTASKEALAARAVQAASDCKEAVRQLSADPQKVDQLIKIRDSLIALESRNPKRSIMPMFDLSIAAIDVMINQRTAQVPVLKLLQAKIKEISTNNFTAFNFDEGLASRLFLILSDELITGARIDSLRQRYKVLRGGNDVKRTGAGAGAGAGNDILDRFRSALGKLTETWKMDGATDGSVHRVYELVKKISQNAHRMENASFTRLINALADACENASNQDQGRQFWTSGAMAVSLMTELVNGAVVQEPVLEIVLEELKNGSSMVTKIITSGSDAYVYRDAVRQLCLEMLNESSHCESLLSDMSVGKGKNELPQVTAKLRDISAVLRVINKHRTAKVSDICADHTGSGVLSASALTEPLGVLAFHLRALSQDPSAGDVNIEHSVARKNPIEESPVQEEFISMPDMAGIFLEEARARLAQVKSFHDDVETSHEAREIIRTSFHTLKGASNVMGLSLLGQVCEEIHATYDVVISQATAGFVLHELTAIGIKRIESAIESLSNGHSILSDDTELLILAAEIRQRSTNSMVSVDFDGLVDLPDQLQQVDLDIVDAPDVPDILDEPVLGSNKDSLDFFKEELFDSSLADLTLDSESAPNKHLNIYSSTYDRLAAPSGAIPSIDVPTVFSCVDQEVDSIDSSSAPYFIEEYEGMVQDLQSAGGQRDGRVDLISLRRYVHTIKGAARVCGANQIGEALHAFETALERVTHPEVEFDAIEEVLDRVDAMVDELKLSHLQGPQFSLLRPQEINESIAPEQPIESNDSTAINENLVLTVSEFSTEFIEVDEENLSRNALENPPNESVKSNEPFIENVSVNLSRATLAPEAIKIGELRESMDPSLEMGPSNQSITQTCFEQVLVDQLTPSLRVIVDESVYTTKKTTPLKNSGSESSQEAVGYDVNSSEDFIESLPSSSTGLTLSEMMAHLQIYGGDQFRDTEIDRVDFVNLEMIPVIEGGDTLGHDGVIPAAGFSERLEKSDVQPQDPDQSQEIQTLAIGDAQQRDVKTHVSVLSIDALGRSSEEFTALRARNSDDVGVATKHADDLSSSIDRFENVLRRQSWGEVPASVLEVLADMRGHTGNLSDAFARIEDNEFRTKMIAEDIAAVIGRITLAPLSSQRSRIERVLRMASKDVGRKVKLDLFGDANVSPALIDKIMPSLEHLLRNSVAHGIEEPDDRSRAGKPLTGSINISIKQDSDGFSISVRDDGRGIDRKAVLAKAVEQGLIKGRLELSERELHDLLFLPGFSTANEVSKISGRGVGLDVVRSDLLGMGGSVSVESEAGKWTDFRLKVPADLSSFEVLSLIVDGYQIALPAALVDNIELLRSEELKRRLDDDSSTLIDMSHLLPGVMAPVDPRSRSVATLVTVGLATGSPITIIASEVGQTFRAIVRPLGAQISSTQGLMAATITGKGKLILIVNPLRMRKVDFRSQQFKLKPEKSDKKTILVVDDSISVRASHCRVIAQHNWEPLQANDGAVALNLIAGGLRPDLILLDIEMPNMDGLTFATAVRAHQDLDVSKIPIIMITSRTAARHREQAALIGVQGYFGKPCDASELSGAMKTIFAG